jgi:hypothetical protein
MLKVLILPALTLAACSTVPAESKGAVTGGVCKDDGLSSFVGRDATTEAGAELLRQSGSTALRWVPKGSMVTMDFRADRVTVYLDDSNKIERVSCG